jgi:Fic family protein
MKAKPLNLLIISFFEKETSLSQKDIYKLVDVDKAKLSGYLEAMADYGDLSLKKFGNSYVYSRKARRKK